MATPPAAWSRLLRAADSAFSSPWSLSTGRLYAYHIRRLVRASLALRLTLLPMAAPAQVKIFFTHLATDLQWAWGTIAIARSAALAWHASAGVPHALRHPTVVSFFSALQRHLGTRPAPPQRPLPFPEFLTLCRGLLRAPSLVHLRDLTMLLTCFIGMRRMSDVLVGRAGDRPHSGICCRDVDFSDPACVSIHLHGMKNDPFGRGHVISFPNVTDSGLPVRQVFVDYMTRGNLSPASTAPLIQGTVGSTGARLSGRPYASWSSRFRQLVTRFLPGHTGLSTRSIRKGGASHAHTVGVDADHIRAVGCWDSEAFNLYISRCKHSILGVTQRF